MSLGGCIMFEPRAFWEDEEVGLLSWAEIGVYARLMSRQWEEGDIPDDRRRLAAVLAGGLRGPVTDEQLDNVMEFFPFHRRWAHHRRAGEWFFLGDDLADFIARARCTGISDEECHAEAS